MSLTQLLETSSKKQDVPVAGRFAAALTVAALLFNLGTLCLGLASFWTQTSSPHNASHVDSSNSDDSEPRLRSNASMAQPQH